MVQPRLAILSAAVLGLSLPLATTGAHAAPGISVSASVSNSKLTVIDLTPDDGKAAGYTFGRSGASLDASLSSPATDWTREEKDSSDGFAPISATVGHGTSTSSSTVSKFGEVRNDAQVYDSIGDGGRAMGNIQQGAWIRVDPHTQLIYSGYGEVSISDVTQYGSQTFLGYAELMVWFGDERWVRGMAQGPMHNHSGVRGGEFSLSYQNNSDNVDYVSLSLVTLTRAGYNAPSPVPEPATYAMFGLGALMVGAIGRRRRRPGV